MGGEDGGVEPAALNQRQELRDGARVHQPGRDGDVLDPELLRVKGRGLSMHDDVGEVPAGANHLRVELDGGRDSDGVDGHVGAKAPGQLEDTLDRILPAVIDGYVRAELLR